MSRVIRLSRLVVIALLASLAVPAFAEAQTQTPLVLGVSAPDRHPVVQWSLPPNTIAEGVEIATAPGLGNYDQFIAQNVVIGEALTPQATSWSDPSVRLSPGTYYVHVLGWDESCSAAVGIETLCNHVVSPTVRFVVRNAPPRVSDVHFVVDGTTAYATFTLCDDASGAATIAVRERKLDGALMLVRYTRGVRIAAHAGCRTYTVSDGRRFALSTRGVLRLSVQAVDYDGAYGNVAAGVRGPPAT